MSAWVRFENKTQYNAIYIKIKDSQCPVLLIRDIKSKYIYSDSGSIQAEIYDTHGHFIKSIPLSVIPAKMQSLILE